MAYTTFVELSGASLETERLSVPIAVTWRVTRWERTDDRRWKVAAIYEGVNGDWLSALAVARKWFENLRDEVEQGRARIKVDPVNMSTERPR